MAALTVVPDGGAKLTALGQALQLTGDKVLERELLKGLRQPLNALRPKVAASARATLPKRGGLAELVAKSPQKVQTRRRGNLHVALIALNTYNLRRIDRGENRHPVFADADHETRDQWTWVSQQVQPGWFSDPTGAAVDDVRRALDAAVDAVARQLDIDVRG